MLRNRAGAHTALRFPGSWSLRYACGTAQGALSLVLGRSLRCPRVRPWATVRGVAAVDNGRGHVRARMLRRPQYTMVVIIRHSPGLHHTPSSNTCVVHRPAETAATPPASLLRIRRCVPQAPSTFRAHQLQLRPHIDAPRHPPPCTTAAASLAHTASLGHGRDVRLHPALPRLHALP